MVTPSTSVIAVDNTTHMVQFNLGSQLPIKLTGPSNFVNWKAQVESLMLGHDLYSYLDGTMIASSKTVLENALEVPNPTYKIWFPQDQLIHNALMASVEPSPLQSQKLPPPSKRGTHYITCMPTNHIHEFSVFATP